MKLVHDLKLGPTLSMWQFFITFLQRLIVFLLKLSHLRLIRSILRNLWNGDYCLVLVPSTLTARQPGESICISMTFPLSMYNVETELLLSIQWKWERICTLWNLCIIAQRIWKIKNKGARPEKEAICTACVSEISCSLIVLYKELSPSR